MKQLKALDMGSYEYEEIQELQAIIHELVQLLNKKDAELEEIFRYYEQETIDRLKI